MIEPTLGELLAGTALAAVTGVAIVIEAGRRRALRKFEDERQRRKELENQEEVRISREERKARQDRERNRPGGSSWKEQQRHARQIEDSLARGQKTQSPSRSTTSFASRSDDSLLNPANPLSPLNPINGDYHEPGASQPVRSMSSPSGSTPSSRSSRSEDYDCTPSRSSYHDSGSSSSSYSGGCSSSSSSSSSDSGSSCSGSSSCD